MDYNIDLSEIIAMALDCGCFKRGPSGEVIICKKCANLVNGGE